MPRKIAIIGGGIAGLTAGYLLHRKYDLTLFERADRLGGNAFTLDTADGQEVDIAAAVFGRFSYKNLLRLFDRINVATVGPARINRFCLSGAGATLYDLDARKGLFLTPGFRALVSQQFQILKPGNVKSVLALMAGIKKAVQLSRRGGLASLSVEQAIRNIPELRDDAKLMFISCLCLITSMHCDDVLDAPADFFFRNVGAYRDFMPPRALFSVRFTKKRTRVYIQALAAPYRDGIMLNANIRTVVRRGNGVVVVMEGGKELIFDKVIFACNADQALQLLQNPTPEEQKLLGAWKYTEGRVVVHRDHSAFPKRELMEGYTFLYRKKGRYMETSVSGSLWVLPGVSPGSDLISTQHPNFPINRDMVLFEKNFRTPLFDSNSCATVRKLPSLNGVGNTYYCGSHFGFGLHEDAVTSAIEVAKKLGVEF
jgi:predicted NAD/FAD-binding protein